MKTLCIALLLSLPIYAQSVPQENAPATKEEKKAAERARKDAEKIEKQRRAEELATPPTIFIPGVKADAVGQAFTRYLATEGFGIGEYQAPQQVFGMSTPHRVAFTKPVTDTAKQISLSLWCAMYFVGVAGQSRPSEFSEFVALELTETRDGVSVLAKAGYLIPTIRGLVWKDETSAITTHGWIEGVLSMTKDSLVPKEPPK